MRSSISAKMSDQSLTTDLHSHQARKMYHRLRIRDCVKLISSLLVPLALGIFTVVITFYQQNVINQQRLEDRQLAKEQREHDMNESRQQRLEDRLNAHDRRELDLNISRLQREQDLKIAEDKRFNDDVLAEKQQTMLREQRVHELEIEQQRHRDELLVSFINKIGELLKKCNWTLTSDPKMRMLVRAKTLAIIRQLDSVRNSHLIRFLSEVGQLTNGGTYPPLDLSTAQLDGIDLGSSRHMHGFSLAGAYLRNASFIECDLTNTNFSGAHLDGARFSQSILFRADFSRAKINHADFSETFAVEAIFSKCEGHRVNFTGSKLTRSFFNQSNMPESTFIDVEATESIFDHSYLDYALFTRCNCSKTRFESSRLVQSDFTRANLSKAIFRFTYLDKANFHYARANGANFYKITSALQANFTYSNLANASFAHSNFNSSTFQHANMKRVILNNINLDGVNFIDANLYAADVSNSKMSTDQIRSSLTTDEAKFPNRIQDRYKNRNLLRLGYDVCGESVNDGWQLERKDAIIISSSFFSKDCWFMLSEKVESIGAHMSQSVNLSDIFKETSHWKPSIFLFHFNCSSDPVSMSLVGLTSDGAEISKHVLTGDRFQKGSMLMTVNMTQLNVTIHFFSHSTAKCHWFAVEVDYDPREY